jgi:hypothetical protein
MTGLMDLPQYWADEHPSPILIHPYRALSNTYELTYGLACLV